MDGIPKARKKKEVVAKRETITVWAAMDMLH